MSECPLCSSKLASFSQKLEKCSLCELVVKVNVVSKSEEKERYETHNNNVSDQNYLNYLDKLFNTLKKYADFKNGDRVLDFGCGPSKGLASLVESLDFDAEIEVCSYDPYFFNIDINSMKPFDVIYASECFEHFNNPKKTIKEILNVLKVGGILAVGTHFYDGDTDFSSWWYLKDKTHIVFYSSKTIEYISKVYGLKVLFQSKSQLILKKIV